MTGVLGVIAGIVTFARPGISPYAVSTLVAWYLVFFAASTPREAGKRADQLLS